MKKLIAAALSLSLLVAVAVPAAASAVQKNNPVKFCTANSVCRYPDCQNRENCQNLQNCPYTEEHGMYRHCLNNEKTSGTSQLQNFSSGCWKMKYRNNSH